MTTSVEAAAHLVMQLLGSGVRDLVLCPGSRSAPLAYAAEQAEREGKLSLHVRHDERSAAFFALGLSKADPRRPAAVITTSGTAVANLMPATLEARHAGVPLLLVTADRPPRLRGTWANQTSDLQAGLLAGVAVRCFDVEPAQLPVDDLANLVAEAVYRARVPPGPVHLNLCFDDPLQPDPGSTVTLPAIQPRPQPVSTIQPVALELPSGPNTVVIAADGAAPTARRFAEDTNLPLLAEPSSGARGGPNLIAAYRLVLAELAPTVQRAIVFGRPTLSRPVSRLLDDPAVELVLVSPPDAPGPGRPVTRAQDLRMAAADPHYLARWVHAGQRLDAHLRTVLDGWPRLTGPVIAREVLGATTGNDALVIGASNPIRDADLAPGGIADGALVLANRGLAGIDGVVSTALGVAAATNRPTRVLLGDLTALHDLGGLIVPTAERERFNVQVIVNSDNGGGIFATLEHGTHPEPFERIFGTPHDANFEALAAGVGAGYRRVEDAAQLSEAVCDVRPGLELIEVPTRRTDLRPLQQALSGLGRP